MSAVAVVDLRGALVEDADVAAVRFWIFDLVTVGVVLWVYGIIRSGLTA